MLDCISGGRLVAGFPTGLPSDAVISNGVVPIEQRERFREALALVLKAWSAREIFAWNGKHYQLGMVNLWPRPIQQPHPPMWIPGSGISSTAEYVVEHDHCFCHLSYFGAKNAKAVTDRYWDHAVQQGPRRQSVSLELPAAHRRRRDRCRGRGSLRRARRVFLSQAALLAAPLSGDPRLPRIRRAGADSQKQSARRGESARAQGQGFLTSAALSSSASPKTVREQLLDGIKGLRMGHLLALLHFGSMPTELCKRNIDLFAREVLPLSRRSVGRQIRGPLVARALEEEARRRPRHGRRILTRGRMAWRPRKHAG